MNSLTFTDDKYILSRKKALVEITVLGKAKSFEKIDNLIRKNFGMLTDEETLNDVVCCVEEIFSNIVFHGYNNTRGKIRVALSIEMGSLRIEICDKARAFEPKMPKLSKNLSKNGGLGIYLVHKLMDEVLYKRVSGENRLVLIKHLGREQ